MRALCVRRSSSSLATALPQDAPAVEDLSGGGADLLGQFGPSSSNPPSPTGPPSAPADSGNEAGLVAGSSGAAASSGSDADSPLIPPIVLGTRVLEQFEVHYELRHSGPRVGLAPKRPLLEPAERVARRNASCAAQATCVGQQRYFAARNECEPPSCGAFFQAIDEEAGVCVWDGGFVVMIATFLTLFGTAEMVLQQLHVSIPGKYLREAARQPNDASGEDAM